MMMRALVIWVGILLLGMQTAAAQAPGSTADIAGGQSPADLTCACEEQQRLVWSCGDVVLVRFEERTSVRFGRKAGRVRPRVVVLLRSSAGRYFVVVEKKLLEFIVDKMSDVANRCHPIPRPDGMPVATDSDMVQGRDLALWRSSGAGTLHLESLRELPLTPEP